MILVTGSSGFVASALVPLIGNTGTVIGIDTRPSDFTDWVMDISGKDFPIELAKFSDQDISIVNLAAARFDFGAKAEDYYRLNVIAHSDFLESLESIRINKFIHISSVASIDGSRIPYSRDLDCDDAYRSTKFLQEKLIRDWCAKKDIELVVLYPSAIFSDESRSDTNIGKLQSISRFIPFIPIIDVAKSLTYLPNFSRFITDSLVNEIPAGNYLTIEKPTLTVSRMIQLISGRPILLIWVPFLPIFLKMVARCLYVLGFCGKIDLKLTPNRVIKLFSDTSYSNASLEDIDIEEYAKRNCEQLPEILSKFNIEKING
jgi:nucleoside-diphosphate-sugar epimerase